MKSQLETGDPAPEFEAIAVGGEFAQPTMVNLQQFRGEQVVLYFYPKDNTPGCTTQACALRDSWQEVKGKAHVFGISVDSVASHERFISKFDLPFPLLSDEQKTMADAYGVWVEKSMYGKKYMGVERSTFVIGPDSRLKAIFRKVKPAEHVDLLLKVL